MEIATYAFQHNIELNLVDVFGKKGHFLAKAIESKRLVGLSKENVLAIYGNPKKKFVIERDPQIFGFAPVVFLKGDEEVHFNDSNLTACFRNNVCVGVMIKNTIVY